MIFSGVLPPGPFFGTLSRTLFALAAKGFSFLSHGRKKRNKESPPAARISVKMEHGMLKHKNSELRSSNSLCFFTPSVLHFLNLKSMRPESSESLQHRCARCWGSSKQHRQLSSGDERSKVATNTHLRRAQRCRTPT